MSILSLLNQIKEQQIVLPKIQRKFVWSERDISKLMDSIMRGYPIGIVLMWETFEKIQYRYFVDSNQMEDEFVFNSNDCQKRIRLVLDGQQRLQSLYIALYGNYEGKSLYLNVLSGEEKDNSAEIKYQFSFLDQQEVESINQKSIEQFGIQGNGNSDLDHEKWFYLKVYDLINMGFEEKRGVISKLRDTLNLDINEEFVVDKNLSNLKGYLQDETILRESTLDSNKAPDAKDRKTIFDILEIFVRVNTEGTRLTRSDLLFSMLKLNWENAATSLPQFVKRINEGNGFNFTNDFVIKCLFSVSGFGPEYNIDILRKKSNVEKIEKNFSNCCDAISSFIDFLRQECWLNSSQALPGLNLLVPFVHYFYLLPKHTIAVRDIPNVRKFFYFVALSKIFTTWADARILVYTRDILDASCKTGDFSFPYQKSIEYLKRKESGFNFITDSLLNNNRRLVLGLIQGNMDHNSLFEKNEPEIDHIFPKAQLLNRKLTWNEIEVYANFWFLPMYVNRNKTDMHPKRFMEEKGIPSTHLEKMMIDLELLDYPQYSEFIRDRSRKIREFIEYRLEIDME